MKKNFGVFVCLLALFCTGLTPHVRAQNQDQNQTQPIDRIIPEGTELQLSLSEPLSSKLNDVGDVVYATVRRDVVVEGRTVIPRGAEVSGRVTLANPAGRPFKGGKLHITFDRIRIHGQDEKLSAIVKSTSDFARDEKVNATPEGTLKEGTSGRDVINNVLTAAGIGGIGVTIAILAGFAIALRHVLLGLLCHLALLFQSPHQVLDLGAEVAVLG